MIAGITGHQDFSNYDINWIRDSIDLFLANNKIEKGYSSLAIGADQVFVNALIKKRINYGAIIPCKKYSETFKNEGDSETYESLLKKANSIFTLQYKEPSEAAFYEAGIKIIELSSVLMAIWNGKPSKGLGGTGDIVNYAIKVGKKTFHINPISKTAKFIND